MAFSLVATVVNAARSKVERPLGHVGFAFVAQEMLRRAGHEALVALCASAGLFLVQLVTPVLPSREWATILAGTVMLLFFSYLTVQAWPLVGWMQLWWRLRIGPRRLLRLVLFRVIAHGLRVFEEELQIWMRAQNLPTRTALSLVEGAYAREQHDQVAWRLAESLQGSMLLNSVLSLALALVPILSVFWVFRLVVVYGGLLGSTAHLSVFHAAIYPIAALIDVLFGTSLRAFLRHE
jgi:hypothetical protein